MTHIPLRMCVACREHRPLSDLIRITYSPTSNTAEPDYSGKATGRGAYICRDKKCIVRAQKKHVIERHLKCEASDALYSKMEEML